LIPNWYINKSSFTLSSRSVVTVVPAMKDPDSNGGRLTNLARRWRKRLAQPQPEADSQETFFSPPHPAKGSSVGATAIVPVPAAPTPVEEPSIHPELTTDQAKALHMIEAAYEPVGFYLLRSLATADAQRGIRSAKRSVANVDAQKRVRSTKRSEKKETTRFLGWKWSKAETSEASSRSVQPIRRQRRPD